MEGFLVRFLLSAYSGWHSSWLNPKVSGTWVSGCVRKLLMDEKILGMNAIHWVVNFSTGKKLSIRKDGAHLISNLRLIFGRFGFGLKVAAHVLILWKVFYVLFRSATLWHLCSILRYISFSGWKTFQSSLPNDKGNKVSGWIPIIRSSLGGIIWKKCTYDWLPCVFYSSTLHPLCHLTSFMFSLCPLTSLHLILWLQFNLLLVTLRSQLVSIRWILFY